MRHRQSSLLIFFCLLPLAATIRIAPTLRKFPFASTPRGGSVLTKKDAAHSKEDTTKTKAAAQESEDPLKKTYNIILSKQWTRFFYAISALNPFLAVLFNDYSAMIDPFPQTQTKHVLANAYGTIFFFAKLKPRVSFAIGAMMRALQLTTAFQYVFDPTSGVGFGLNLICLFAKSRWPATIVLGWSLSKAPWKILGASTPSSLPVPITVSWKPPEDNRGKQGYRIGL